MAAELSKRGFIVSPTSRNARGADVLVTDVNCKKSYAVQVKTNAKNFKFWLLNSKARELKSGSLIYAFVNMKKDGVSYYLVPSKHVATNVEESKASATRKNSWYSIGLTKVERYRDNWNIFN